MAERAERAAPYAYIAVNTVVSLLMRSWEALTLDLRQFTTWCRTRSLPLFAGRRTDIEGFAREPEARGRARATRRLSTRIL